MISCPVCGAALVERGASGPSDVGEWNDETWLECRRRSCGFRLEEEVGHYDELGIGCEVGDVAA